MIEFDTDMFESPSGLTDVTIAELEKEGYTLCGTRSFTESWETESWIVLEKQGKLYIAQFGYCSCYGLWDEDGETILAALKEINEGTIAQLKQDTYYEKEATFEFLDRLL